MYCKKTVFVKIFFYLCTFLKLVSVFVFFNKTKERLNWSFEMISLIESVIKLMNLKLFFLKLADSAEHICQTYFPLAFETGYFRFFIGACGGGFENNTD